MNNIRSIHKECAEKRKRVWQKDNAALILESGDWVKLTFDTKQKTPKLEHMWVLITETNQKKFKGTLDNDPKVCLHLKHGDKITFNREDIEEHLKN